MAKANDPVTSTLTKGRDHLTRLAALLGVLTPAWLAVSALGTKWGWWGWREGLLQLPLAGVAVILIVAVMALIAVLVVRPWGGRLLTGIAFAGPLLTVGLLAGLVAGPGMSKPPIHDISTDLGATTEPTVALMVARGDDSNPIEPPTAKAIVANPQRPSPWAGKTIAAAQAEAYPDVKPLVLSGVLADAAFKRAEAAIKQAGWAIVTSDPAAGRIEATATTFWYGFKDDVIVQITPEEASTRIDVRSISRVGLSDMGANAKRIDALLKAIEAAPAA
jgi:uncharacterized protein (DUF1499 family)